MPSDTLWDVFKLEFSNMSLFSHYSLVSLQAMTPPLPPAHSSQLAVLIIIVILQISTNDKHFPHTSHGDQSNGGQPPILGYPDILGQCVGIYQKHKSGLFSKLKNLFENAYTEISIF